MQCRRLIFLNSSTVKLKNALEKLSNLKENHSEASKRNPYVTAYNKRVFLWKKKFLKCTIAKVLGYFLINKSTYCCLICTYTR